MNSRLIMANPWHRTGPPTVADLELLLEPLRVAIVTERADNPGVSITNAAEHVHRTVTDLVGPCVVVECYGPASYAEAVPRFTRPDGSTWETFDLVTLGDDGEPRWHRVGTSRAELLEMLAKVAAP